MKEHIVSYLRTKFGGVDGVIQFPPSDDLYTTVVNLTTRRPANVGRDDGNVEIAIPHPSGGKRPETFSYLSPRAVDALQRRIETRFWAELHDWIDDQKHRYGVEYIVAIEVYMSRHNLTGITEDALLKNYYRWRDRVRRKERKRSYTKQSL